MFIVVSLAATLGQHGPRRGDVSPRSCSITWHSFSPWHNLSKLSSAHGLPKELLLVVKVVQVVFSVCPRRFTPFSGRTISFLSLGLRGRLACHRLGPPFVCQYVKDRGDMDSAGEADVCRGQSGGGVTQESCSCCKVKSFCQPCGAIRCDWVR